MHGMLLRMEVEVPVPGRLRRMEVEVAVGTRGHHAAGPATVKDITRGSAPVESALIIDCQSALGKGLRPLCSICIYLQFATGWCEFHLGALCVKRKNNVTCV